jgi:hypothetical protein
VTPEEKALRDAFLAELWPVVREYHEGDPLPKRKHRSRRKDVDTAVEKAS